jgi:flagellar basal body rod protein FlgC
MSLFDVFSIAGSEIQAQSQRLIVVNSNLANAESEAADVDITQLIVLLCARMPLP